MQNLTKRIMIAMLLGALVGVAINGWFKDVEVVNRFLINGLFYVVGAIFVASLKMLVVPLVFVSLVGGSKCARANEHQGHCPVFDYDHDRGLDRAHLGRLDWTGC
jgi:Na+/H+-dicarboxylate symporter